VLVAVFLTLCIRLKTIAARSLIKNTPSWNLNFFQSHFNLKYGPIKVTFGRYFYKKRKQQKRQILINVEAIWQTIFVQPKIGVHRFYSSGFCDLKDVAKFQNSSQISFFGGFCEYLHFRRYLLNGLVFKQVAWSKKFVYQFFLHFLP